MNNENCVKCFRQYECFDIKSLVVCSMGVLHGEMIKKSTQKAVIEKRAEVALARGMSLGMLNETTATIDVDNANKTMRNTRM